MMTGQKKHVLMCCSSLDVKGGMVSVIKNYLSWGQWDEFDIELVPTHIPGGKLKVGAHFAMTMPKISRALRSGEICLAHLHVAERGSFYRKALILREAKRHGVPVILHHHAAEFEEFLGSLGGRARSLVRDTCEMADVNVVLSEALRETMRGHFPNARFKVLYNAVPTSSTNRYDPDAKGIVFMGRLGERKGTFDLIRAFAEAAKRIDSGYSLILCGDGEIARAERAIEEVGLAGRAACRGWVGPDERASVLRGAALNVLPSYNEGLPMSILEAMSFGVPTVSTNIAAIPEVIRAGENGELIEPGDLDALAATLAALINDRAMRTAMSGHAYELINRSFALGSHIRQVKEIYRGLC